MSSTFLDGYKPEAAFADELGVTIRTTRNYRNRENGLPYLKMGGTIFIPVKEGRDWIASQIITPNQTRKPRAA